MANIEELRERVYEPVIFLMTDISQAGSDLLQLAGSISAYSGLSKHPSEDDLRKIKNAVRSAADALANYETAMAAGNKALSRKRFNAATGAA